MRVLLKVIGGKNDGREIAIAVPRFIIGRGESAHLRPASDLVSREHSAIEIKDGTVTITDLKSRNGTFVNGEKIADSLVLNSGDSVRIGRLQFEMIIDHVQAGAKKPKVTNVIEAASRTASSTKKASLEDSITDWLLEGEDDDEEVGTEERIALGNADTVQFNLEDTTTIKKEIEVEKIGDDEEDAETEKKEESKSFFSRKGKPQPKKLPPIEAPKHDSSTSAADDVLKKFFNRR